MRPDCISGIRLGPGDSRRHWRRALCFIPVALLIGCFSGGGPPVGAPSLSPDGGDFPSDDVVIHPDGGDEIPVGEFPELSAFENHCVDDGGCPDGEECLDITGEDGGLCIITPQNVSYLTDPFDEDTTEFATSSECVGDTSPPPSSGTVDLFGVVDRFGSGGVTRDVEIRVFFQVGFKPEECDPLSGKEKTSCYEALFNNPDILLGETTSFLPPAPVGNCKNKSCEGDAECPLGYACEGATGQEECTLAFGLYALEGMPINTPLVVMTRKTKELDDWHDTFLFNTIFHEAGADENGNYRYDPITVSHGQWQTVPNPFGVSIGVGNGVIGGRLRECVGDHVGWYIYEAAVAFGTSPAKTGYFNDKESNTLPDPFRTKTNLFGRYTGLDVPPGPNWVTAAYYDGEQIRSLGAHPLYIFPNGLSVLSFPGPVAAVTQPGVECDGNPE